MELYIFTDGSVNTKLKFGFGAFLAISDLNLPDSVLKQKISLRRFEPTSSTKLEIQTMVWVLNEIKSFKGKIIVFTDSQNIVDLPGRRERLEKQHYHSKQNKPINNAELYQVFYSLSASMNIEFVKIAGHQKTSEKNNNERIFTLVDKASRKALREENRRKLNY